MLDENESEPVKYTLKPKQFERVNKPVHEEKDGPIEVSAILQQNIQASQPRDRVPPVLIPVAAASRKAKDFWLSLFLIGLACGLPLVLLRENHLAVVCIISAFAFLTVLLSWIFWALMDRY